MRNNEKEKKMDFAEKVASKMKKGLSNEIRKICEIGRVLRDVEGLSPVEVNYHMSVDEDFIPDVLQSYKGVEKRKPVFSNNNLNPWINHPKKT
jgi:hypothetical protein